MDEKLQRSLWAFYRERKFKEFCHEFSGHVISNNFNESPQKFFSTKHFITVFERAIIFAFPKQDEEIPENIRFAYEKLNNFPDYPFASSKGIFIPAFMKSGGTYFTTTLSEVLNKPKFNQDFIYGYDFDFSQFSSIRQGYIVHNHVLASPKIIAFCKIYKIRPIFLFRDIFECLASRLNFDVGAYENKAIGRKFFRSPTKNADIAIYENAFHYLKLFHSWRFWSRYVKVFPLDYCQITNDIEGSIKNALRFLEIDSLDVSEFDRYFKNINNLNDKEERKYTFKRFQHTHNVNFSEESKNIVRELYQYFDNADFSFIDQEIKKIGSRK